ncbi:helix-turn-helix transcriptional regulator [Candidatus Chrysopegis kryptomonas]|uniref:DNA-binding transcriptional regulator, XRE-family HTH domain n=1 Tax=Candidatus Chryseopegocella kryptomonas TaxID=1633643 RepID=A0A0P1MQA2_9BACT|nr:helix-turn-helix transcriptional regulator [Candidatus Chrysopegis kryptomonas]CUS97809.1 DNA-binding transcriptional regulator, XRE-family HTH domain [Candidatus Chrysopegis kryptomonas]
MTLGEALRQFRIKNDMSQKQMAFLLKISTEYYCKIENDKIFPSTKILLEICRITGIEIKFNGRKIKKIKNPWSYFLNQDS